MLTIEPRPRRAISPPNTWQTPNVYERLRSTTVLKSSSGQSSTRQVLGSAAGGWSMPALFTSTLGGPSRLMQSASAARRSSAERISHLRSAKRSPCCAASFFTGSGSGNSRKSRPKTRAPLCSSARIQTGPRLPKAPVTTAVSPSRLKSGAVARLLDHVDRQRLLRAHVDREPLADQALELVRRQAAAGRLHHDVGALQHLAFGQRVRRVQALAHLGERQLLAVVGALDAIAERDA